MTLIIVYFKYYCDNKKFDNISFKSKYSFLAEFLDDIKKISDPEIKTYKITK